MKALVTGASSGLGKSCTERLVKDGIEVIAAEYEADEVLLVNIVHDHAARKRSYQLIADAFGWAGA